MSARYAELHCLSNFTFLRGASHAQELVETAIKLGYEALAITDECSLAGVVRAHAAAKNTRLKLIIGAEFRLDDDLRFVLLAQNREGYGNLSDLITRGRRNAKKGSYRLSRQDIGPGLEHCLALWLPPSQPQSADASWLAGRFPGRIWIAIELLARGGDWDRLAALQDMGKRTGLPCVACGDVHMHVRGRRALQDVLTAIRLGMPVAQTGCALYPSGERHLRRYEILERIYPDALLQETLRIAERCDFSLKELRYEYPEEIVPDGETPTQYLRRLTEEGLRKRYPHGIAAEVQEQAGKELALIAELGYEAFFLTVYDVVRYAREQKILCQGRGSAANSVVCFALGITEVDPSRTNLLFERFISKERNEPPDIDVDFEHERREEVIQHIYNKYGRDRAALAATVISYRTRSALRDIGKALGLDTVQLDRISSSFVWWDRPDERAARLREAGFDPQSPVIRKLIALTNALTGFPRHLSQHVGGFVISRGPLSQLVPIENAAMARPGTWGEGPRLGGDRPVSGRNHADLPDAIHDSGVASPEGAPAPPSAWRTNIQWDKNDLDELGLLKVDVLALGMLSAIRRALEMVNRRRGTSLSMADILATEDGDEGKPVYDMLCKADSIGVFQIESRAQMSMLPRLKPRCYYDLVIEVAIVRPGPIQSGMVHPYLNNRKKKPEDIKYSSPALRKVLERTLGVPIFQEQVMQIAIVAADFSPGKADQLRRAMAAWKKKGGLEPFKEDLVHGMLKNGYDEKFALQIFEQIKGFGEYGFPESHSASFALLVYVSSWLKRYEHAAFTCALLNSQPMGFYAPAQLVQDAQRHGVEVRAVDVMNSEWECTLERGTGAPSQWGCDRESVQMTADLARVPLPAPGSHLPAEPAGTAPPSAVTLEDSVPGAQCSVPGEKQKPQRKGSFQYPLEGCAENAKKYKIRSGQESLVTSHGFPESRAPSSESLSPSTEHRALGTSIEPALRLGLRMVKGLSESGATRLLEARTLSRFESVEDLLLAAKLSRKDMNALAAAGALESLAGHRRNAAWLVAGIEQRLPVLASAPIVESAPALAAPTEGEDILADYASLGLTLGRHPLALLRPRLKELSMITAEELRHTPTGTPVHVAGLVTCRQHPGTAKGVIFVTLEDETGQINVVVWKRLSQKQRRPLLGARLLGVDGILERESGVTHLIAEHLTDHSALIGDLVTHSRDFH